MDTQILDTILLTISNACAGNGTIQGYATSLFGILITIDFVISILLNLLSFGGGQNFIGQVITKILSYGFWLWIIQSWGTLCNAVVNSLTEAGTSFGALEADVLKHPSTLIDIGIEKSFPLWDYITKQTTMTGIIGSLGIYLLAFLGAVGIFLGFAMIAFQVFITFIEFYIASALMLLFIPFATNKYTERFAQNCIGGVFSTGVKLMFMGAIISLSGPMMSAIQTNFDTAPTWENIAGVAIVPWAIAFLAWQAPSMAAGFMSGGPALSAATLASNSTMTAASAFSGAKAGASSVGSAASGTAGLAGAAVAGASSVNENTTPSKGALQGMGNFALQKTGLQNIQNRYKAGADAGTTGAFGNFNNTGKNSQGGNQ